MLRTSTCHALLLSLAIAACGPGGGGSDTQDGSSSGGSSSGTTAEPATSTGPTTSGATGEATGDTTAGETGTAADTTSADTGTSSETGATTGATTGDTTGDTGGLPDGACRSNADCDPRMGESCYAPDELNCGACQIPDKPCVEGDGCAGDEACVPFDAPCACNPGETHCIPQCSKDSCGDTAVCNAETGICEPLTCAKDGIVCPPLFDCVPDAEGDGCVRRTCTVDDDCDGAPCVEGECHDTFGACMPPAP
jgi:hypothetical protein